MSREDQITQIEHLLQPFLTEDIFLVHLKIKPVNNIKIYLDADSGLGIEKCIRINRALYKAIEEKGMFEDGNFSLEVSSPGIDEPLKHHRQYLKNVGRDVEVTRTDGSVVSGKLTAVDDAQLSLEYTEGKNKKAVTHQVSIPFTEVGKTIVLVKF